MKTRKGGKRMSLVGVFSVFLFLGGLTLDIVNPVYAEEILIKGVPYVHQRWRLD